MMLAKRQRPEAGRVVRGVFLTEGAADAASRALHRAGARPRTHHETLRTEGMATRVHVVVGDESAPELGPDPGLDLAALARALYELEAFYVADDDERDWPAWEALNQIRRAIYEFKALRVRDTYAKEASERGTQ